MGPGSGVCLLEKRNSHAEHVLKIYIWGGGGGCDIKVSPTFFSSDSDMYLDIYISPPPGMYLLLLGSVMYVKISKQTNDIKIYRYYHPSSGVLG